MPMFESTKPESFQFTEILYEKKDWVAYVTINRPKRFNAYSTQALAELIKAFTDAANDDSVAVIVYTGAGDKAFCTGGDVVEYEKEYCVRPRDYWKYMGLFGGYIESIMRSGKPTIARLNGMAVGGGNESQLACDLSIIAEHAYIAQVGTNVGSVACGGSTQWLPIVCGDRRAREILMLNERISPQKALDWGLVNKVAPSVTKNGEFIENATPEQIKKAKKGEDGFAISLEMLDHAVAAMVEKLKNKFPECTRYTKANVNFFKDFSWFMTAGHTRDWLSTHYTCWEPNEGMAAFVEKRPADYMKLRTLAAEGKSSEFMWGPYRKVCPKCGAKGLPSEFEYCGACGGKLS